MKTTGNRVIALATILAVLACTPCAGRTLCENLKNDVTVEQLLEWCSKDRGLNEGASCGQQFLEGTGPSVPERGLLPQIYSRIWDRETMISTARLAAQSGHTEAAVSGASCCQIHNPGAFQCLNAHRNEVGAWLRGGETSGNDCKIAFKTLGAMVGLPAEAITPGLTLESVLAGRGSFETQRAKLAQELKLNVRSDDWKQLRTVGDLQAFVNSQRALSSLPVKVKEIFRPYEDNDDVSVGENISKFKRDRVRGNLGVPADEDVLALVDITLFGTADHGVAFSTSGLYFRSNPPLPPDSIGRGYIKYSDFPLRRFALSGTSYVSLDNGMYYNWWGSGFDGDKLVTILNQISREVKVNNASFGCP